MNTPTPIKKFMSYGWCNIKGDYIPMGECVTAADHEHALTMLNIRYGAAAMHHANNMQEVTEQRDTLAEALKKAKAVYTPSSGGEYQTGWHDAISWVNQQALQSLKQ